MTERCQMKKNNDPLPYVCVGFCCVSLTEDMKARYATPVDGYVVHSPRAKYDYIAPHPATTLASIKDVLVEFREGTSSMGEVVLNIEKLLEEAGL